MTDTTENLAEGAHRYWDSFIGAAVRSDEHTVELVPGDPHGIAVAVDGVQMFDEGGYPEETFTLGMEYEYHEFVTYDGLEKMKEVYRNVA